MIHFNELSNGIRGLIKLAVAIGLIIGFGWTAHAMYNLKADKTEVKSEINKLELRVANTLDSREWRRYQESIEENQLEQINLEVKPQLNPEETRQLRTLKLNERKYEKQQKRFEPKK